LACACYLVAACVASQSSTASSSAAAKTEAVRRPPAYASHPHPPKVGQFKSCICVNNKCKCRDSPGGNNTDFPGPMPIPHMGFPFGPWGPFGHFPSQRAGNVGDGGAGIYDPARSYMIGDGGFVANKSSSFKLVHFGKKGADRYGLRELNVHFLDKEHFEGFDSQDFLQLGAAKIETRFCCISHWRGHAFDMADGIIGLGWVGSQHSPSIIKTLSEPSRPAWHIASQPGPLIKRPTFAFLAGPEAAEVHLGGYDPAAIVGGYVKVPIIDGGRTQGYALELSSMKIMYPGGEEELLDFVHAEAKSTSVVLDTGSSCTLLPGYGTSLFDQHSTPWHKLYRWVRKFGFGKSIEGIRVRIALGNSSDLKLIEFPLSDWSKPACVEKVGGDAVLFGSAFFQRYLVQFDMESDDGAEVLLARLNPDYKFVPDPAPLKADTHGKDVVKVPVVVHGLYAPVKEWSGKRGTKTFQVGNGTRTGAVYLVRAALGTPPQKVSMILDTGSYMMAVRCGGLKEMAEKAISESNHTYGKPRVVMPRQPGRSWWQHMVAHFFGGMRRVMDGMGPPDMGTFGFPQIGGAAKSGGGGLSKFFH